MERNKAKIFQKKVKKKFANIKIMLNFVSG